MKESEYNIDVKETDKLYDIIDEENTNLIINIFLELLDKICEKKIEQPITIPNYAARYS
jgi:hypothetical protein